MKKYEVEYLLTWDDNYNTSSTKKGLQYSIMIESCLCKVCMCIFVEKAVRNIYHSVRAGSFGEEVG